MRPSGRRWCTRPQCQCLRFLLPHFLRSLRRSRRNAPVLAGAAIRRSDTERPYRLRAERHHQHEVHDVEGLDRGERGQHDPPSPFRHCAGPQCFVADIPDPVEFVCLSAASRAGAELLEGTGREGTRQSRDSWCLARARLRPRRTCQSISCPTSYSRLFGTFQFEDAVARFSRPMSCPIAVDRRSVGVGSGFRYNGPSDRVTLPTKQAYETEHDQHHVPHAVAATLPSANAVGNRNSAPDASCWSVRDHVAPRGVRHPMPPGRR